jgi:hypothetical protein
LKKVPFTRDMFLSSPLQKVYGGTPKISYGKLLKKGNNIPVVTKSQSKKMVSPH